MAGVPEREAVVEPLSLGLTAALGTEVLGAAVSGCTEAAPSPAAPPAEAAPVEAWRPWRVCPQTWWCFSQSLCWQKEPQ